ncbi:hypothetical protein BJX62DRAFT_230348 [Aspergillus germanicus]
MKGFLTTAVAALGLALSASALPTATNTTTCSTSTDTDTSCGRECMTRIVNVILKSMAAGNWETLPLANVYTATENSHPAAISMMTLWRTVTKAGTPSLLAIDTTAGFAYFSLAITEGNDNAQSVLNARVKVVNKEITELELFINRSRGDHGFSLSPKDLADNYKQWMSPPANRTKIRARPSKPSAPRPLIQPRASTFPSTRPTDSNARLNVVIHEELGIVITGALVPGKMVEAQAAQDEWLEGKLAEGTIPLVEPLASTGEVLEALQYYDWMLQAEAINVYLSGPAMSSVWVQ